MEWFQVEVRGEMAPAFTYLTDRKPGGGFPLVVRMLRGWAALRDSEPNPLPGMITLAEELGQAPVAAIALLNLFQLAEASLGRPLNAKRPGRHSISTDERAILLLLTSTGEYPKPFAPRDIPHGLPGALSWAIVNAKVAMGLASLPAGGAPVTACPFDRSEADLSAG